MRLSSDTVSLDVPAELESAAWMILRGVPEPPFPWGCTFMATSPEVVRRVALELRRKRERTEYQP